MKQLEEYGLVSCVITTHNRKTLLPRAIESVLRQTYGNIELIVVSDGCTDGTDELMHNWDVNPHVHYISYTPAQGGNHARNVGIKATKGEYIAFLDDDDEWLPEKIERQVAVMQNNPSVGLVYCGLTCINVEENITYVVRASRHGNLERALLMENICGSTSRVMLRRQVLEQSGLFDEQLPALQDWDLWIRVAQYCEVGCVSEPLLNYYNHRSTVQVSSSTDKYQQAFSTINYKYAEQIAQLPHSEQQQRRVLQLILLGNKAFRNRAPRKARQLFAQAFIVHPSMKPLLMWLLTFAGYKQALRLRSKN